MKLGSLPSGRDGRLVVVSRDLAWCADATHIAPTLQAALDDWEHAAPLLEALATDLAHEVIPMMRFHERAALAPLPRAYQRIGCSASGRSIGQAGEGSPLLHQAQSDAFLPPRAAIPLSDPAWACDFGAEVIVVIGDVPQGIGRDEALAAVRLVGLSNEVTLRNRASAEPADGSGCFPSTLSPVLATPDELGDAWRDGKLHHMLKIDLNGGAFGRADTGEGMTFDFGTLIAQAARRRPLGAGTIVGSGTVFNPGHAADKTTGGSAQASFAAGDTVRMWIDDPQGHAIFGVIEQEVQSAG